MKCGRHLNAEAVAQCSNCGTYMCSACREVTLEAKESYGTLCPECFVDLTRDAIAFYKRDTKKNIANIIIAVVTYIIGAIIMIISAIKGMENSMLLFFIGYAICGVYPAIEEFARGKAAHAKREAKHGVTYIVDESGNVKRDRGLVQILLSAAVFLLFGVITTPFHIIKFIVNCNKNKKRIATFKDSLNRASSV